MKRFNINTVSRNITVTNYNDKVVVPCDRDIYDFIGLRMSDTLAYNLHKRYTPKGRMLCIEKQVKGKHDAKYTIVASIMLRAVRDNREIGRWVTREIKRDMSKS